MTADEPSHLLSSYLYWHGRDRLPPRDMPPLIKIVGGWVPAGYDLPVDPTLGKWGDTRHEWTTSFGVVEKMDFDLIREVLFRSRLPLLVFPCLTVLLLWRWGRQLFSPRTAVVQAGAFAFEPTALGHGAWFKNDHAATFGYLLFWFCAWRYWREPSASRVLQLALALFLAVISKLSMLIVIPAALAVVAARFAFHPGRKAGIAVSHLAAVLIIPYLSVLAAYQFETHRISAAHLGDLQAAGAPAALVSLANLFRVIPVAIGMWDGFVSLVAYSAEPSATYLLGEFYPTGSPLYFLVAMLVKAPVPVLALFTTGVVLLAARCYRGRLGAADWLWIAPGFLYAGLASLSSMQMGLRLILPALPFGLLLCGVAVERMRRGRYRALLALALGFLVLQSARIYPHGLTFFNLLAGGPEQGLKYLTDSNLDWGQALPELVEFMDRNGIQRVKLAYFGGDTPYRFMNQDRFEDEIPPWSEDFVAADHLQTKPGYYAISASLLQGQLFQPRFRHYYDVFKAMEPIGRVGNAIYVYKVNAK